MISAPRLGLAGGILWGLSIFVITVISIFTGYAAFFLQMLSSIYIGLTISWWGSIIGLIYGFVDAFVGLLLLGWIYNLLAPKPHAKRKKAHH